MNDIALQERRPRRWFDPPLSGEPAPIRGELMSVERLEQFAAVLAQSQPLLPSARSGRSLLQRSRQNARVLRRHYESIAHTTSSRRSVTPAAEWFVDNYYVVERQLQLIRDDLPSGYYRQLPKLAAGELAGLPRITGIAWAFVAHTDSHFEAQMLMRFVGAYQRVETLTIGELWALASMLRVVLIENLRRCADRIVSGRALRGEADALADRLLGTPAHPPEPPERVLAAYRQRPLPRTLAVQLVQRLRDCDPSLMPALRYVEELLQGEGASPDVVIREELQRQSAANVTVRNIVTSLVQLSALDWTDIVEQLSVVDAVLAEQSDFTCLDFPTRNRYRNAIEEIARDSGQRETQIAQRALQAAAAAYGQDSAARDPGYYLIGPGRAALERSVHYHRPLRLTAERLLRGAGIGGYLLLLALSEAALLFGVGSALRGVPPWAMVLLLALLAFPASEAIIATLNNLINRLLKPQVLPALDLGGVIPEQYRTLVAVPVLLNSRADIDEAVASLETQYLASARGELYFALVADGRDADVPVRPEDEELIVAGQRGIATLNERYGPGGAGPRFLWLHRARRWNEAQQCWMGWERKRGKLHELNRLLRGAQDTTFVLGSHERAALPAAVRYVLVLDADTQLPHGAAEKLIAKMSHPLNQPRFDAARQRVVRGYGILQPRVTPALPSGGTTLVQTVLSGTPGLDPYAFAVSDLYQDLFGEGSFTGKGLYDIDAFERSLAGRITDNTVLSHDLLEGLFARAAVVSDVEVVEPSPDRYDVVSSREHRWARGDWQLLRWLRPRLLWPRELRMQCAISGLGLWKLADNLRRTLVPIATVAALVAGWLLPQWRAGWWTALIVTLLGVPSLLPVLLTVRDRPRHLRLESERQALRHDLWIACLRWALTLVLLADRAWWMADAVVRTLLRLCVTRQRLLDWTTAAHARRTSRLDLASYVARMRGGLALAAGAAALVAWRASADWWVAGPWLALWFGAPLVARVGSVPRERRVAAPLPVADAAQLRQTARRTWRYFEEFVTAADHFLPPDNYQETPVPVLAQRTSPTNIGMYLLSSLCALEFGWLGLLDWLDRLEATFDALDKLERFRGHWLNWYDTRTGQPLLPNYVSTVDSGNLAGALLTVANGLEAWAERGLWSRQRVLGVEDALALADPTPAARELQRKLAAAAGEGGEGPGALRALAAQGPIDDAALAEEWQSAALRGLRSHLRDFEVLGGPDASAGDTVNSLAQQTNAERQARVLQVQRRLSELAARARQMAYDMDFSFLLKPHRMLLSIGFNVGENRLDGGDYDLLASEARLASFIAIAKRDVPARHWFRLDRRSIAVGDTTALLSWSGSMFEYLMPALFLRVPDGSLLDRALHVAVQAQRDYGRARHVPWGISESAYNTRDLDQTYQYSPFGVPTLGLKRGLANDLVVAPYATGLAAMIEPGAAAANYRELLRWGALGHFGFYEALDFTAARLAEGEKVAVVRAYMAHHQGMTIVAIVNALSGGLIQQYFHTEATTRATALLLQERPPRSVEAPPEGLAEEVREARLPVLAGRRRLQTWRPRTPHTQLLSNGAYAVMVAANGAGCSRWRDLAVTRWREDSTCDDSGQAFFLRDRESGLVWSAGYQPSTVRPDSYRITFTEDRVELMRRDGPWTTRLQVLVSSEHDAEARRVSLSNHSNRNRDIEVTSYLEPVLASAAADRAHRAFSNLFVQTEYEPGLEALLAGRRPRSHGEAAAWAAHLAVIEGERSGEVEFETDRLRFVGRDGRIGVPRALHTNERLSGRTGIVLDPIFSLRYRVRVPPGATARLTFWTVVAATRAEALRIADKCREPAAFDRASTLAWTSARVLLHHLGLDPDEASAFQRLAAHLFYLNPALRPSADLLRRNRAGVAALWALGVSGDLPIVLVEIDDVEHIALVRQLLRAHEYLTLKNLPLDLVIVNASASSYVQDLQTGLEGLTRATLQRLQRGAQAARGSVYVVRADLLSPDSRSALWAAARASFVSRRGTLTEQLDRLEDPAAETAAPVLRRSAAPAAAAEVALPPLELDNGVGGFAEDGREYLIVLRPGVYTPMPWLNVIGRREFGFQVSATGAGYTWSRNSRENALTPWSNDAVGDPAGETLYLKDEESGHIWTATAAPVREAAGVYLARHGQGYSRFSYTSHGIAAQLLQFVPPGRAVKVMQLTLRNESSRARQLSVCAFVEWVLGTSRAGAAQFVLTEPCPLTGALLARNPWNARFGARVAFLDLAGAQSEFTCDRREFLGVDGRREAPLALRTGIPLSGRSGAGLDPCAALRAFVDLPAGATRELVCFLGQAEDAASAATEVQAARNLALDQVFAELRSNWDDMLLKLQVKTPDRAFDLLLNRWLPYQVLSCRVWARTAFYQSSGAYGFRDQLQDVLALTFLAPQIAREHLVRAAGRQFAEGDVQHWWMPENGQGIRSRISDDRVWLAYCMAHYVSSTGDAAVLDEQVPYLTGDPLPAESSDIYFTPQVSAQTDSVYEHCARALDTSLAVGAHGLPLIGGGDWNDGFNEVGAKGRGESVWLGWFLCATLSAFSALARSRGDRERVTRWQAHHKSLRAALEDAGWDGDWYRRGYFDDGSALGSARSDECRIDGIAQAWAVLSGAANPARAAHAMAAVYEHLVRREERQLLLFTPPFQNSEPSPGYIQAYPPGIRENGGQYTHGAIWSLLAFAKLGDGDRAKELFDFFSPIQHSTSVANLERYKLEPYAVAADIYAAPGPAGRGGWSWYTGAAGWLYRAGLEAILGLRMQGEEITISPCVPRAWRRFDVNFWYGHTQYHIMVTNPFGASAGVSHAELDHLTILRPPIRIRLLDDRVQHTIRVVMG
ncbi:MAG: glycosyl transferase [Gammaproteobacteria bacterium]|nr:glycosyl transferase [Gammaproteobacteria bacterium]